MRQVTLAAPTALVEAASLTNEGKLYYVGVYTADSASKKRPNSDNSDDRAAANRAHFEECTYLLNDADLIVFNLFALVAWHVAQHRGVPAVCCSPCMIPYQHPDSFPRRFKDAHPELHAQLRQETEQETDRVGWGEISHWMWPLFLEKYGAWREELGMHPFPLLEATGLPAPTLPQATPLVYAISEAVVPRPGYWPGSVSMTGFWVEHDEEAKVVQGSLQEWVLERCGRIVYVGFGSMAGLGLVENPNPKPNPNWIDGRPWAR